MTMLRTPEHKHNHTNVFNSAPKKCTVHHLSVRNLPHMPDILSQC